MKFSRSRIIRFIVMLAFLVCMLFANFIAVRKIMSYGVEVYFYDKLLVAYNIGAEKGMREEFALIRSSDRMPRELGLIKDFQARIGGLKDPAVFLSDKVEQGKKKVNLIRNLRSAAIALMIILFGWRLIVDFANRFKSKGKI